MHFLFGDETNTEPAREVEFFIYGALVLDEEQLEEIHDGIDEIREDLGLRHDEPLKFSQKPRRISAGEHREAKRQALDLLEKTEAVFIAYCVHHRILHGAAVSERNEYALNTVLWGFHRLLDREGDHGMVVLDQLPNQTRYVVSHLNNEGLRMYDGTTVRMPRITGIATAHVEWSHGLSACDLLLGAFRYCVNKPDTAASQEMFPSVVSRLWHREDASGRRYVREWGLFLRPKVVKAASIKARYDALVAQLQRLADEG